MKKYLAYDACNTEYEEFDTLKEAQDYINDSAIDDWGGGICEDVLQSRIYQLVQTTSIKDIAIRENMTQEEWDEEGYDDGFDRIGEIVFNDVQGE